MCYWHLVDGSQDADKYSAMCGLSPSPQKKKKNLTPKVCTVEISWFNLRNGIQFCKGNLIQPFLGQFDMNFYEILFIFECRAQILPYLPSSLSHFSTEQSFLLLYLDPKVELPVNLSEMQTPLGICPYSPHPKLLIVESTKWSRQGMVRWGSCIYEHLSPLSASVATVNKRL